MCIRDSTTPGSSSAAASAQKPLRPVSINALYPRFRGIARTCPGDDSTARAAVLQPGFKGESAARIRAQDVGARLPPPVSPLSRAPRAGGLRRIFGDARYFHVRDARLCTVKCPECASGAQVHLRRTSPPPAHKSTSGAQVHLRRTSTLRFLSPPLADDRIPARCVSAGKTPRAYH